MRAFAMSQIGQTGYIEKKHPVIRASGRGSLMHHKPADFIKPVILL